MKTHEKLGDLLLFRLSIILPIGIGAVVFTLSAWANDNWSICFRSECINYFFELYKYPISLLGLSVPLTAIVAALHRSEETALQMKETSTQNMFNNFIKHREEFSRNLEALGAIYKCRFHDQEILYRKIFPKNSYNYFSPTVHDSGVAFLETLTQQLKNAYIAAHNPESDESILLDFVAEVTDICFSLKLKPLVDDPERDTRNFSEIVWPTDFYRETSHSLRMIVAKLKFLSNYKKIKTDESPATFKLSTDERFVIIQKNSKIINELVLPY